MIQKCLPLLGVVSHNFGLRNSNFIYLVYILRAREGEREEERKKKERRERRNKDDFRDNNRKPHARWSVR